jgi:hypothetical protein
MEVMFVGKPNNGAVVQFTQGKPQNDRMGTKRGKAKAMKPWVEWYPESRNLEPDIILEDVYKSNINPGLIKTKVDFICGKKIFVYTESEDENGKTIIKKVKDPEVEAFFYSNNVRKWYRNSATDLLHVGSFFAQFRLNILGKVARINHLDASTARCEVMNEGTGEIEHYYLCADWGNTPTFDETKPNSPENTVTRYPSYNPMDRWNGYPSCIYQGKDYVPGFPYYPPPSWRGAMNWIKLANEIPMWHINGLKNGYNLRWHIKIPMSYFNQFPENQRDAKKTELRENLNKFLSGTENVGKAFISFLTANGISNDEWKIEPLTTDLKDSAFITLFEQSNTAMTSAHGIDPTLAGIALPGKLGSGSDKEHSYNIFIATAVQSYRDILLAPLYEIARLNGWNPEYKFGIEDTILTTLDKNPSGFKPKND